MDLVKAIKSRRTVRKFKQLQVDKDTLYNLIDAARLASCGANLQPLRYIVVQEQELVNNLLDQTNWAGNVKPRRNPIKGETAPLTFIVVTKKAGTNPAVDAGAAIENLQLMACGLELGCCWIGAYDHKAVDKILELDENTESIYLVAVGYPDETPVSEDIELDQPQKYYLDDNDVLHVPKYSVNAITEWR